MAVDTQSPPDRTPARTDPRPHAAAPKPATQTTPLRSHQPHSRPHRLTNQEMRIRKTTPIPARLSRIMIQLNPITTRRRDLSVDSGQRRFHRAHDDLTNELARPAARRIDTDSSHKPSNASARAASTVAAVVDNDDPSIPDDVICTSKPPAPAAGFTFKADHRSACAHVASRNASRISSSTGRPFGWVS